ncbi:MAG: hypothetical protein EWV92_21720 [Microcystis aeruginosa Ma_MB_S_20031200_S102]|uniref:Uncharacterized protein n=1 Tax=Microcystis aeruginosa Ma_MB_S_20031200_S102 TaxID=2486254 RepID=A0A552E8B6_MICAE|nr:MAG: hypothetical protein EWV79_02195 [Microcystis aeruginosa Ma_MB_S_20031200_S102D]TRU30682.1 MAG: hypothetical protein EWV92_21720 [Microcystis aeruginosa Ma_MB_S_20031200_S102]
MPILICYLYSTDLVLLLNFLVAELLRKSGIVPLSIQDDLPRQGLHDSFEAAAILAQALLWQLLFVSSLLSITLPVHEYQNNS